MSELGNFLIFKYCQDRTLFNLLRSKSKLIRHLLKHFRNIQLKSYLSSDQQIKKYCHKNDRIRLAKLIDQNIFTDWNVGLKSACRGGHREIVDLMIKKGANEWNNGLNGACQGGHREIVDLMIVKGATDWNWGLIQACHGGYQGIVNLMILKGATDWNWGLANACHGGDREIVDLIIRKGATNLNWGLQKACLGGHREIVDLMIKNGATECYRYGWGCGRTMKQHLENN